MTDNQCYVYLEDNSFDVGDTHTLDILCKCHYEVCLLTQTVDPPPSVPIKGRFETFDYPKMPSSSMYTSAVGKVTVF